MKEIKRIAQVKIGNTWKETFVETNPAEVYKWLSHDLIAKKINKAPYIRTIKRVNTYDGFQNIIITYDNACRSIFIIEN